ncbi:MAG TPA: acyl-CoA thioesterase [Pseudonocardiaceae bacterium]|jgi:acyl-CoA thioester hydrolase|nr:acyl-CoA thioesterase [Pseudonocardiaceae bacterium]
MESQLVPPAVRPDPARTERHHYPQWQEIATRFGDLDPLGHVNNVAVARLYEESRVRFAQTISERTQGGLERVVLAALSLNFLGETVYPEPVEVGLGVVRVGRSSWQFAQALYQHGKCVGLADSTIVHAPLDGPSPLPGPVRAELEKLLLT